MENPKVSIISTTYNDKENLKKIIAQVKKQDYDNIEYVIVDGGSTDGTREVIAEAEAYFGDRLKWISEKDKGIYDAINKGIRNFIIGIGGSATNDGGIGMLKALGFTFLDKDGQDTGEGGQALAKVASVRLSDNAELLSQCNFKIACDVTNPLCGFQGATYIYGPQKGVTSEMLPVLDAGMENYAKVTSQTIGKDNMNASGAGAAGGLGFAFLSYLNGELTPGIQLILNAVHLEDEMKNADVVVTGEGRLDHQTAMGKAPVGVAKLGKKYGAKTVAFAGSVTKEAVACNEAGIDAFFPIVRGISTLSEAMDPATAKANMAAAVEQVFRLL